MSDKECVEAAEFTAYTPQQIVMIVQLLFCICAIVINVEFILRWRDKLFFHVNFRILLWTLILLNIAHAVFVVLSQGVHLYKIYMTQDVCDVYVPAIFCYSVRMPATACFFAQTLVHISIVIERAMALKNLNDYESRSSTAGKVMAILSIVFAFVIIIVIMNKYNFARKELYCSPITKETQSNFSLASYSYMPVEALIVACFYGVYHANKKQINLYVMRMNYQARENFMVLRLLIPLAIFHFVVYISFFGAIGISTKLNSLLSAAALRAYIAIIYVFPIYNVCSPLLLWYILRQYQISRSKDLVKMSSKISDESNVYFSNYAWNMK